MSCHLERTEHTSRFAQTHVSRLDVTLIESRHVRRLRRECIILAALTTSCRPSLPPSLAKLAEKAEQFSFSATDPLPDSFSVGELRVDARVQPDGDSQEFSEDDYSVTARGRLISTLHCRTFRNFRNCKSYHVHCEDSRGLFASVEYSEHAFWRGAVWNFLVDYEIEAEQSAKMSAFRIYPSHMNLETNVHSRLPGAEPVAALVQQPPRRTILIESQAPQRDSLWVGIAMLLGIADKIHYSPRWREECSPSPRRDLL